MWIAAVKWNNPERQGENMAFLITERCVKCGACESECPNMAIVEEEKKFNIDYKKCLQCGNCIDVCPNKAIDEL